MITLAILAAAAALQSGWTWTLYEATGDLVLANEIPDTPQLRATLQCEPGSGVARIDLYGGATTAGFATLTSGDASATAEMQAGADHRSTALRADHPVFTRFVLRGRLDIAVSGATQSVDVQPAHLSKLHRFAELCAG